MKSQEIINEIVLWYDRKKIKWLAKKLVDLVQQAKEEVFDDLEFMFVGNMFQLDSNLIKELKKNHLENKE